MQNTYPLHDNEPEFKLELDVAWDCPIQTFYEVLWAGNATVHAFDSHGPAGGNPNFTLAFKNQADLDQFRYHRDTNWENYPDTDVHHRFAVMSIVEAGSGGSDFSHENQPDVNEEDLAEFGEGRGMEPTKSQQDNPE